MARNPRQRQARGESVVGRRFTVTVGPVAHGGHCVARVAEAGDRVVFVRHALPGEEVVVEITEGTEGDRFWRGDAVSVRSASPDRVPPPCPYAGPALCGGCDFQHVALPAQRELKAAVVREQLARLARLEVDVEVEPVPGDDDGLGWRTRMEYAATRDGRRGMRQHRSREVVAIDRCLIAHPDAVELPAPGVRTERVLDRRFRVAADGFWQVHPGAPSTLVTTVLDQLAPRTGERVLDLYAGVGLFAGFLGDRVGDSGRVVAVEGDKEACRHARANLSDLPHAEVAVGSVDRVLASSYDEPFDLVVLDPPREGARRTVVGQVVDRRPRAVAYVACDPAALARDLATFAELGYRLTTLRAFDLFPMTHHVECVALVEPA
jgi:tRNA/tmRNA/rRNA uracil-C5-methylase (TrmA/RlmC/RlmD family)